MKNLRKFKSLVFFLLGIITVVSCEEPVEFREPIGSNTSAPGPVSNVEVENMAGKSKLTYRLPADKNLLYVKAVYNLATGRSMEVRASYYTNQIVVEGFADTLVHDIKLYSVSRNEVASEPVTVQIKPLEAPIWKVFKSINVLTAFGGYDLKAVNPTKSNISIMVMKRNVVKEFEVDNQKSVFTSTDDILSKVRGLDTLNYEFAIFVKDRWGNSTDTVYKTIKPIFEAQILPNTFRAFRLPGDAPQVTNGAQLEYAWDNRFGWPYTSFTHQINGGNDPHIITFDMGVLAKLSRFWIRPFPEGDKWFYLTTMKRFEIYGSANPNLNGVLDNSWVKLGTYEIKKLSALPYGTDSGEDQAAAAAGFNFDVDLAAPKVRYIRIRCLENWAGGTAQSINELKIYGDPRR